MALAINVTPTSTIKAPQYVNQPSKVPVCKNVLTNIAAPNQKIKLPIVSDILSVFEWNIILSAKIMICSIPIPMLNCISAE